MTPQPDATPNPRPAGPDGARARELLARKWAYLLSGVAVIPLGVEELGRELLDALEALCAALTGEPFDAAAVERVGERIVALGYVGEDGLRRTAGVVGGGLLGLPEFQPVEAHAGRVALAIGALATGFLAANRRLVFEQQERMQLSLLKAVRDAKWNLAESEARFDEVVTSSASGVVIVGLDGRVVRANAALAEILGRTPAELAEANLFDLVHPDTVGMLREGMAAVAVGGQDRVRQSHRLLRADGDVARISLTASLLRDPDGAPSQFVVVVEDGTELVLLQGELHRQALHDVLTGLPNRQFFGSHLEGALRRADLVRGVTLLHLDLDAFGMVCDSLGRRAADRLLVHVAQRLRAVVAREKAMVARFDGDGFGILVENSATTPNVAELAASVNRALAEPVWVDGHGLALSASIGAVHRVARDQDPDELLRAADRALRRARTGGRGQRELVDPGQDAADRWAETLAVGMPGAWEQGEITPGYRPVVDLADAVVAGGEALLRWAHPRHPVPHEMCVELAERTGLALPLGEWLLGTVAAQVRWWRQRGIVSAPMTLALTPHQSADADLVVPVVRALDATGLPAAGLSIAVPVRAVAEPEAADNLGVLAEMGVRTALSDFAFGVDDLDAARGLAEDHVRVPRRLVDLRATEDAPHVASLVAALAGDGVVVAVDGVATEEQEAWWRAAGADLATGPRFGPDLTAPEFLARIAP
ncbi:EAL domain-containing protein [Actinokineospora soli]